MLSAFLSDRVCNVFSPNFHNLKQQRHNTEPINHIDGNILLLSANGRLFLPLSCSTENDGKTSLMLDQGHQTLDFECLC